MKIKQFLKKVFFNKTAQLLTISTATVSVGACAYGEPDDNVDISCCFDNDAYTTIYEQACANRQVPYEICDKDSGISNAEIGIRCCGSFDTSGKYIMDDKENKEFKSCVDDVWYYYDNPRGPLTKDEIEACRSAKTE